MDISFWSNLSPKIKVESSTKNFYKQYFYKLDVYAPGCKSIRCDDIAENVERRRHFARSYNPGSWHNSHLLKHLNNADIGFLYSLKDIFYEYPDIKIRTEEPKVSFYALDETMLQSLAKSLDPEYRQNIIGITGPADEQIKNLLKNNVLLVKKKPKFKYRIFLKEKQFDFNTRTQIFTYLNELGDLVRMTDHTRQSLMKPHDWIWGCYFYTDDRHIAEMVRLINPDIIREVSEFICLDNK